MVSILWHENILQFLGHSLMFDSAIHRHYFNARKRDLLERPIEMDITDNVDSSPGTFELQQRHTGEDLNDSICSAMLKP